jgi:hypothetical protein
MSHCLALEKKAKRSSIFCRRQHFPNIQLGTQSKFPTIREKYPIILFLAAHQVFLNQRPFQVVEEKKYGECLVYQHISSEP